MRAGLGVILDKQARALAGAKFRAWWDGVAFDAEAFEAARAPTPAPEPETPEQAEAATIEVLFDAPNRERDPRIAALELLWGEGRVAPGEAEVETAAIESLGVSTIGALAILSPSYTAPLMNLTAAHKGAVRVFEWREEVFRALEDAQGAGEVRERTDIVRYDLAGGTLPPDAFAGIVSTDDFTYAPDPAWIAQQIKGALKRGGRAVIETYCGQPSPEFSLAFASAFSEQRVDTIEKLRATLIAAGLEVKTEEDVTEAYGRIIRARFLALREEMAGPRWVAPAIRVAQELAWELESWRVRLQFLSTRRLERRRLTVRR